VRSGRDEEDTPVNAGVNAATGDQGAEGDLAQAVLRIEGMHCGSCSALIEETLLEDLGVAGAHVDLEEGRATVTFDPSRHSVSDLCDAVAAAGYRAVALEA
jgi:copper chaperone